MGTTLTERISNLRNRKTDRDTLQPILKSAFSKSIAGIETPQDAKDYVAECMEPVPETYTAATFRECDRVMGHVQKACDQENQAVTFRHQGSTTNNTHIKFYSDIDLLVLTQEYIMLEPPLRPTNPYGGLPIYDLYYLRLLAAESLKRGFPKAEVDESGSKAITISGGSLKRSVDVVVANWLDTPLYRKHESEILRGVHVLDAHDMTQVPNFPFLHNAWIDIKDGECGGQLRRLIRFLKAIRSDSSPPLDISSYDITALVFNAPSEVFEAATSSDLLMVIKFIRFALNLAQSESRYELMVPNQTRALFGSNGLRDEQLSELIGAVVEVIELAVK